MADLHEVEILRSITSAQDLDIRLSEILWSMPRRGLTDLQKGVKSRLQAEVTNLRDLRRYLNEVKAMNEETR